MKVLFVSDLYPSKERPQYCIFLEQQALAIKSQGHTIDILILQKNNSNLDYIENPYIQNGLNIYTWYYSYHKLYELLLLPGRKRVISQFLKRQKYDVISMHFGSYRQFEVIGRVCRKLNTSLFMHYHGLNVWGDYYANIKQRILLPYHTWRKKLFLQRIDAIIGVSDHTCKMIRKHYKNNNIFTVYNGVDSSIFKDEQKKKHTSIFQVLCVGNLIPIKGQKYLLQAIANVSKKYQVELLLVGDGSERQNLENEAIRLGITKQVKFLGTMPYNKVAEYMAGADMFVMPSYFEAFGCVYVESMASGTLTCGCKNNGAEEIIQDGIDGFLLNEQSSEDISEKIIWAIENPERAHQIATNGKQKAKQFSWEESARTLVKVYSEYCK